MSTLKMSGETKAVVSAIRLNAYALGESTTLDEFTQYMAIIRSLYKRLKPPAEIKKED